ncbi:helix-turn-helix transcriptional regulator [Azospirillum sp. RWY-5-1]|uniref:Helix-turn-helix transcriptional regulator n=1 Tax=Azospirillum oleiclasticum TaxID=2735135 RepID=A0ABX2T9M2_9PROT|nr:helix-turn-helix transcriptional regulator [Azospirillum oleiclasticum]NYZ19684.1 helix-turn-helix transcriptional regulator [Azospirillum oleiclasticum]
MDDLGTTLRRIRTEAGRSLAEAAELAEVTKGYLSKVEQGKAVPSIAIIQRLAAGYGVRPGDIFNEAGDNAHFSLVRANDRRAINRDGTELGYVFESVGFRLPDRLAEVFVLTLPPVDDRPKQFYRHKGQEIFFMLEGQCRFFYGGAEHVIGPGDCVYFDAAIDHRGEAAGEEPAKALVVILPQPQPQPSPAG